MIKTTITCDRCGVEWEETEEALAYDQAWHRGINRMSLDFCSGCNELYKKFLADLQEIEEALIQQFLSLEPDLVSSPEE